MGLNDKIEEIRNKPEHVRIRYVWIGVLVTMILIIVIWFFSLKETFRSTGTINDNSANLKIDLNNNTENSPSMQDLNKNEVNNEINPQDNKEIPSKNVGN
jgi:hypothetical protein